jgi:YVTN family beta-propeller protein
MATRGRTLRVAWAATLAASAILLCVVDLTAGELKKLAAIELPGPSGQRFDYLTIDYDDHYLFCAHLGAGRLYVIDLQTNKLIKTISNLPGIEGVEYAPDVKKLYTSNWHEDQIGVIDVKTLEIVKKIPTESKPDGSAYAAPFHKLYVSDERAKAVAVVDTTRDEVLRMLRFDSETGMPQYDPVAKKIYVNLQDQNIFAVINPENDQVVGMHPLSKCKGNHGMALDAEHRRAFLACEENSLLTVLDLDTFEPIAYLPLPGGADVVKFDPGLNRIYVACYSGVISVLEQKDPQHYRKVGDVGVAHAVHSIAVDTETHRVYAPLQEQDGIPVARLMIYQAGGK